MQVAGCLKCPVDASAAVLLLCCAGAAVNQLTPLHAAALLRPGVDAIVLPSRPDVREFYGFVKATTGLQEGQVGRCYDCLCGFVVVGVGHMV